MFIFSTLLRLSSLVVYIFSGRNLFFAAVREKPNSAPLNNFIKKGERICLA